MEDGDLARAVELRQGVFQLHRLVQAGLDKGLERALTEGLDEQVIEPAAEALGPHKPHAVHLAHRPVQDTHIGVAQHLGQRVLLVVLIVVVAQDGDLGQVDLFQHAEQDFHLARQPGIGQVAGQDEDIRPVPNPLEQRPQFLCRVVPTVQVAHGDNTHRPS